MSLLSSLYRFAISGVEAMLTATTVEKLSDALDLHATGIGDGAQDLYLVVHCTDRGNAAAGASFALSLKDCDTVGGTYGTPMQKVVPLADLAVGEVYRAKLPSGLKRWAKFSAQGAASMTGGATFVAGIATS